MTIQFRTVAATEAEARLDRWLRRHFPQLTQGALQKMLRTGQIRVDGKRAEANTRLLAGQEVRIPPLPEGPASAPPARPPVDPLDAMLDALRFGAEDRPRLVHRLDRDTSGTLVLARTPAVAAKLAAAFRGRD